MRRTEPRADALYEFGQPTGRDLNDAWRIDAARGIATFDLRRVVEKRRLELWRGMNASDAAPFDVKFTAPMPSGGYVSIVGSPSFSTCHISIGSNVVQRTANDIRRGSVDAVIVNVVASGTLIAEQNGRSVKANAGDILLVFMDVPFRLIHVDHTDVDGVRLPASEFPPGLRDRSPVLLRSQADPTAILAAGHVRWQPRDFDEFAAASDLVRSQMLALLSFGIERPGRDLKLEDHLFEAVRKSIDDEIANPDLTARLLCARLGISRTALFEILAANGTTLGTLIRERRLRGCFDDLRRSRGAETLTALSARWGFRDLSSFSRAFRRRFGDAPSHWMNIDDTDEP